MALLLRLCRSITISLPRRTHKLTSASGPRIINKRLTQTYY
jgi:hypothetical protein